MTEKREFLERSLEVARHLRLGHYPFAVQSVLEQQMNGDITYGHSPATRKKYGCRERRDGRTASGTHQEEG